MTAPRVYRVIWSCILLGCLFAAALPAAAQIDRPPATMSFQGSLLQADGKSPVSGPVDLEVRIYANKTDATAAALWAESHTAVALFQGTFAIILGEGAAIPPLNHDALDTIFDQSGLWLGVTVVGEAGERPERQQLVTAPYAFTAVTAVTAVHGVPAGTISVWCGAGDPPVGWLPCDGSSVLRNPDPAAPNDPAFPNLFAAIGTTWGDGSSPGTTFALPNFGGRALVGETQNNAGINANSAGQVPANAGLRPMALGDLLGEETHTLTDAELPAHTHSYADFFATGTDNASSGGSSPTPYFNVTGHGRTTASTGGSQPHPNMQPSVVMTFIIKY